MTLASSDTLNIPAATKVSLNLESKAGKARQRPGTADYKRSKSGHAFSAANPYGVKSAGDKRQFVRV